MRPVPAVLLLGLAQNRHKPTMPVMWIESWLQDPTQLSSALSGILPLELIMSLDDVANQYAFPAIMNGALILIAGNLAYLRLATGLAALIAQVSAAFTSLYVTRLYGNAYWSLYWVNFATGSRG